MRLIASQYSEFAVKYCLYKNISIPSTFQHKDALTSDGLKKPNKQTEPEFGSGSFMLP